MRKIHAVLAGIAAITAAAALPIMAQTSPTSLVPPLSPERAAPAPSAVPVAGPVQPGQLTATDVNAWLDGFMPLAIGRGDIPGAVVVVVKDGQILAQRGYGFSDVAKSKPVDPALTLFRPGSISKLFTWTAVMQQVEQGKLNLDEDVNRYLDFKIPPYEGKPVTLRHIMTHTAGFEEQVKDIITTNEKAYVPFDRLLKRWVPKRVYAPGSTPAYSNYATSLAGYIVQRVSKQPFDAYVESNIFGPLGMSRSTFRQPLPANLRPLMSEGYSSGKAEPFGYEFVGPSPAGSLAATGENMGRFMIAHLQKGAFGSARILAPQTAELMHARVNQPLPGLNGMALGFYQHDINGRRVIAHGGDTSAFHSDLHLFLDEGVGLFVSFNSGGRDGATGPLRTALFEKFADRYFPGPKDTRTVDAETAKQNAERLAGSYSTSRRIHTSFLSITDLLGQTKLSVGKDGELVGGIGEGQGLRPRKWIAAGPLLWREAHGKDLLSGTVGADGVTRFSLNGLAPIMVWDRAPWYRNASWLLPLLFASLAVLLLTALLWPTRAIVRRRFGSTLALGRRGLQAYRASRVAATAILGVLVAWALLVTVMFSSVSNLNASFDPMVMVLQLLSIIVFIGGFAVLAWYAWVAWSSKWKWTAKAWSVALVIAAATILYIGFLYNLIGWGTDF